MAREWLIPAALLACAGCGRIDEDWLMGEAPSPDDAFVARLWCEHLCDVPGRLTLTVSPASRPVERTPSAVSGFPPTAVMPDEDVARRLSLGSAAAGIGAAMRWDGPRALTVSAPCLADLGQAGGPVSVTVRATGDCPAS